MSAPLIARITGGFLLVFGIAGFAPGISTAAPFEAPVLALDMVYRFVFGMFATNAAHAALDILLGLLAFFAARSFGGAIAWCRVVGWWSVVLVIFGSIPLTNTLFGSCAALRPRSLAQCARRARDAIRRPRPRLATRTASAGVIRRRAARARSMCRGALSTPLPGRAQLHAMIHAIGTLYSPMCSRSMPYHVKRQHASAAQYAEHHRKLRVARRANR